ncbi:MAG: threonine synthase [Sphaerochaetaceae bacterium]
MHFKYICSDCGHEIVTDSVVYQCPVCAGKNPGNTFPQGNLIVEYDPDELKLAAAKPDMSFYDFFPYSVPTPEVYPVGSTPIIRPRRIAERYGFANLMCKMDSALPSGSFKDRASQLVAAQAIAHHENRIALASTGNAGAAMSCAGAAYGLDIILFVPETAPVNKLMQSVLYGATVVPVHGTYDDAFALSIEYTRHFGGINRNTAYNPMTIEGKKSVSIELFSQLGRKVPDVVYVPVGDGCIIAGVYKGFHDLLRAGAIAKVPHLVCCQSDRSDAISRAFNNGNFSNLANADTRADSISVESPANGRMAVRYLHESDGWTSIVSDSQIFAAQLELAHDSGIFVEPAAACAYAGFLADRDHLAAKLGHDASVCLLLTGTGFKDMAAFNGEVSIPPAIPNSVQAVIDRFSFK